MARTKVGNTLDRSDTLDRIGAHLVHPVHRVQGSAYFSISEATATG
jgi:hypothetical protein